MRNGRISMAHFGASARCWSGSEHRAGPTEVCPRLMVWLASACGIVMCRGWGGERSVREAPTMEQRSPSALIRPRSSGSWLRVARGYAAWLGPTPLPAAAKGAPGLELEGEEQVSAPSGRDGPYQREVRASGCLDRTGPDWLAGCGPQVREARRRGAGRLHGLRVLPVACGRAES